MDWQLEFIVHEGALSRFVMRSERNFSKRRCQERFWQRLVYCQTTELVNQIPERVVPKTQNPATSSIKVNAVGIAVPAHLKTCPAADGFRRAGTEEFRAGVGRGFVRDCGVP